MDKSTNFSLSIAAAFKTSLSTWNALDIVINNAGVMKDAVWELEIAINCVRIQNITLNIAQLLINELRLEDLTEYLFIIKLKELF